MSLLIGSDQPEMAFRGTALGKFSTLARQRSDPSTALKADRCCVPGDGQRGPSRTRLFGPSLRSRRYRQYDNGMASAAPRF